MTKKGFLNLSEEEQDRVFQAALDEFSQLDYDAASLNRIIQKAGISKGSMYHYFHNKEDLYLYVLDRAIADKAAYLKEALSKEECPLAQLGLFELIHQHVESSTFFAREYPRYHMMNLNLQNMAEGSLKEKVWGRFSKGFDSFVVDIVKKAMQEGELRTDIDEDFVIRVLRFFLLKFSDFYQDYQAFLNKSESDISHEITQLIGFLEYGLKNRGRD